MGFTDLDSPEIASVAEYSEFMNTPLTSDAEPDARSAVAAHF